MEEEKWRYLGKFSDLKIEGYGNKRRLVDPQGKIKRYYFVNEDDKEIE